MLGLCIGGFWEKSFIKSFPILKTIVSILSIQSILILIAYPIFNQLNLVPQALFILFIVFFLISGILTGSSYPLCAQLLQYNNISLLNTAVNLELLDHWGGSLAGLITGLFMLPLLGVFNTLLVLFFVCFTLLVLFLWK